MATPAPAYLGSYPLAADAPAIARVEFLKKTYAHLVGAIVALVGIEAFLFSLSGVERLVGTMISGYNWLIVLGLFMVVNWVAERWARSAVSLGVQYAGLALYVVAEAIVLLPLLYIADRVGGKDVIPTAVIMTLALFSALSAAVFFTGKDFSFLGPALWIGGTALFGLFACGMIFGFSMGLLGAVLGLTLAVGYVLYDTSRVLHHYRVGQHVAASLALFAAIALMFWYILRLVMYFTDRR